MASEDQQQRRDRDDDLDSMYSDDVSFTYLVPGTIEEQTAAREACDDGDNDSSVSGSVVTSVESCFDVASEPQPAESKLGITRRWVTGFILGGHMDMSPATDPAEDGGGNADPDPGADPDPTPSPASSPDQENSQKAVPPHPPALPIDWVKAPREYQIEEMPGFLHFDIQNGRRVAIFDERTWKEGFTRGLRKHIMKRARRDDDYD